MGQAGLSHHLTLARNMPKATAHVTFWAVASHMALQVASENAYKGIINSHESLQVLTFNHGDSKSGIQAWWLRYDILRIPVSANLEMPEASKNFA